jgi:hypothetical protein
MRAKRRTEVLVIPAWNAGIQEPWMATLGFDKHRIHAVWMPAILAGMTCSGS